MMGGTASESAYRILMGVLESRTGQTLSPNRIWRIEMSLKPVMQRHGIADLDALVAALVTSNSRQLLDDTVALKTALETAPVGASGEEEMRYYHDVVAADMDAVRDTVDRLETLTAGKYWPYPTFYDLLFSV